MALTTIYTKPTCPYCAWAKALLLKKGAEFNEINIEGEPAIASELRQRSGRHTVPQIYIGEHHVGGYDDLLSLEAEGRLDALLGLESQV